ncbi:hypothetical protein [Luteolibacter luteus]|uniref:Uncharacterized protein n=1 Tax=Luteolibacter luteus TaxID=2728835 RepID=A0A858RN79_9BACT|nr:hypothetical protein [Luteolibacter luteus]QJE98856.1 hypothetical protein HHL09_24770 [Luteolibacter luteus]
MTPKPLYRSLTFWSGTLVVAFICLTWLLSWRFDSVAEWGRVRITQGWGNVSLHFFTSSRSFDGHHLAIDEFEMSSHPIEFPSILRPEDLVRKDGYLPPTWPESKIDSARTYHEYHLFWELKTGRPVTAFIILIPHWFLLITAVVLWSVLLVCRARYIRRASQSPAS